MIDGVFFFMYVFAGFAGMLAILLAGLLIKYWSSGNKALLGAIRNFMICTALIDALYFWFEYDIFVNRDYGSGVLLRVADICLFIGQVYFWAAYMREKTMAKDGLRNNVEKLSLAFLCVCVVLALFTSIFVMDDYYHVETDEARIFGMSSETAICVLLTAVNLINLKFAMQEVLQKKCRGNIKAITALLVINGLWNGILVMSVMRGEGYELENMPDPTSVFLLLINTLTVLLILSEDFSALFKADTENDDEDKLIARLDYIAETHFLTERERQVMELAYRKMTNPEIAEELCISKYTVKNHMHNIFEKLDISTRGDLILFIDDEK